MSTATAYLLSYPRSGSTLVRTWFAVLQGRHQLGAYAGDVVRAVGPPLTHALDDLRLIKSHHFHERYRPAISLVRDGRDASLSNLFLKYLSGGHSLSGIGEVAAGLRLLADEGEDWTTHVAEAHRRADELDLCVVRFEDLLSEPVAALGRMVRHLGREVPDDVLAEAVAVAREDRRYFDRPLSGFVDPAPPGSIWAVLQAKRDGHYWEQIFDDEARRVFHERGATPHLMRLGYESSASWWREPGARPAEVDLHGDGDRDAAARAVDAASASLRSRSDHAPPSP